MRKITVFYDKSQYTLNWLSALLWAKKELYSEGYRIEFDGGILYGRVKREFNYDELIQKIKVHKYDIVFVAYHHTGEFFKHDYLKFLECLKNSSKSVVWLDTADSAGSTKFEVLPYVDLYLKKQIYADMSLYKRKIYGGGRLFAEYFNSKYGVEDANIKNDDYTLLDEKFVDKLGLSWNVALGNLFITAKYTSILRPYKRIKLTDEGKPLVKRHFLTYYRGASWKNYGELVGFQRKAVEEKFIETKYTVPDLSHYCEHSQYLKEMADSVSVTSPFGWGEICTRDFEAFAKGCILIKGDMSHLKTYPNYFVNNETYLPLEWGYEDYGEVLDKLNEDISSYEKIAENGFNMFKNSRSDKGNNDFAKHISVMLNKLQ